MIMGLKEKPVVKTNPTVVIPICLLEAAMKYHGVLGAQQQENKDGEMEWVFLREGKPTILFTDACVIYITGGKCGNFRELKNSLSSLD